MFTRILGRCIIFLVQKQSIVTAQYFQTCNDHRGFGQDAAATLKIILPVVLWLAAGLTL
jgi:hypothetical protein